MPTTDTPGTNYAVIRAGGRQYRVAPGDEIEINRLAAAEGEQVRFPAILVVDGGDVRARSADLDGVEVTGEVVAHGRGRKIRVFNYHAKTGWRKTKGHRQDLTTVRITGIGGRAG